MVGGEQVAEGVIEVNGVNLSGYHTNNENTDGHMVVAMLITQCLQGENVLVRCLHDGTHIIGTYGDMWTSAFTGVLLHAIY